MEYLIGFHISVEKKQFKKTMEKYLKNCNVKNFQIFLCSPKIKKSIQIDDKIINETNDYIKDNNIFLVCHSPYVINISSNDENTINANIEYTTNEIKNIVKLGGIGSIYHVGKSVKLSYEDGFNNMFNYIKKVINILIENNINGYFILETGAGCGTEIAITIEELGRLYKLFTDEEKKYFKFCLDTCHMYSAGYDITNIDTCNNLIKLIEQHINWNNIACIHLNDSKNGCNSKKDRHENFGIGSISKNNVGITNFIKYCINMKIPLILETPIQDDKNIINERNNEINLINKWLN